MTIETMLVKTGEQVSRSTSVNTELQAVTMFNVSKNDITGHGYKVNWMFDFSDCTEEDILLLAARSTLIAYRKNFRKVSENSIPNFEHKTINVKEEVLNVERRGKSDEEKAKDLLSKMSPEQIQKALKDAGIVLADINTEE